MKPGRNSPCPCGSGRKYKHCCGAPAAGGPAPSPQEIGALVALVDHGRLGEAEYQARARLRELPGAGMLWKILSVALVRQGKDALEALRRAAELLPRDAEAHANLGAALHDRGQWPEALASLDRALEIEPRHPQALIDAGNALRALGRTRESVPRYRQALELDPGSAEAHNNLGNAFLELGQCTDAVACYRRALHINADAADVHCNLGNALRQLGKHEESIESSRRAIALNAGLSAAHNNLGLSLTALGRREEAASAYRQALLINPGYVEALLNLANLLPELGGRGEAIALYRRALELDPGRAESHRNFANLLFEFRRFDEAEAAYRQALALEPHNALTHASLGAALRMEGRAAQAEESGRAALAIEAGSAAALSLLGELRADRGQFSDAEELFRQAIAADPDFAFAFYSIALNRKMTGDDAAWLAGIEALLARPLPLRHEISLRFALGKYYDDLARYDQAFDNYRQANELTKRYGITYDREQTTQRIDRLISTFDAAAIGKLQSAGQGSERPVLIIGMPRSGTSLTEQILASHPAVLGAGELPFWQTALRAYEAAESRDGGGAALIPGMASNYLDRLAELARDTPRVIDKMPLNFLSLGLICAALPRGRIIHLRRHPIDTCLSIYFNYFSHLHPYANDLGGLAHYYREYVRLMDHWRAVLPATTLLEVPYEALIEDQEGWTRRMLEFIGLPWDPKCLDFHQTERTVITLSKWQVRQKMNSASAGRWRRYEEYVGPLRQLLDLVAAGSVAERGAR